MTLHRHDLASRHRSPLTSDSQRQAPLERPGVDRPLRPADLLRLQRTIGNRAVGRLLARQSAAPHMQRRVTAHEQEKAKITYKHPDDTSLGAITLDVERPKQVIGIIESGKRGPTPEPLVVTSLGAAYQALRPAIKKAMVVTAIMTHGTYDRGHLMAAEMGGEDAEWNIVPQWSLNQQSGEWRGLEKEAAKKKGAQLVVTPKYSANAGHWQNVGVPNDIDYKINEVKSKRPISSATWDNAPNENDLLAASEVDTNLEIMQSIRAFVAKSGTVDVPSILSSSQVDKDTQETLDDFIQYRNEHGSAKKKKKLSDKTTRTKKKTQLLKQMMIQGELEGPSSVGHKTPVTEVRKLKGITVSGSSLFDETDEAETDLELELSDHDSDEDIDLSPTRSSSTLFLPPKHRPASGSGSGSGSGLSASKPLFNPMLPPYPPLSMPSKPLTTQTSSGGPLRPQPHQITSTPKGRPVLYPPVPPLSSLAKPLTHQSGSGSAPPMSFTTSTPLSGSIYPPAPLLYAPQPKQPPSQTGSLWGTPPQPQPRQFSPSTLKSVPLSYPPAPYLPTPYVPTPKQFSPQSGSAPPMHFTTSTPPKSSARPKAVSSSGGPLLAPPSSASLLPKTSSTSGLSSQKPVSQMDIEPSTASSSPFVAPQPAPQLQQAPTGGAVYAVSSCYFYDGNMLGSLIHGQITGGVVVATGAVKSGYFAATVREGACAWGVSFMDPKGERFDPKGKVIWFSLMNWPSAFQWRGFTFG